MKETPGRGRRRGALWGLTLASIVMTTGCGEHEPPTHSNVDLSGEHLLGQPPPNWEPVAANASAMWRIAEFVPATATEPSTEKITFESLAGDPLPDPIEFVRGVGDEQSKRCERYDHINIYSGLENAYPTSVRLLICAVNRLTGQGEITLIKTIRGNDGFYVIRRTRRMPPFGDGTAPLSDEEMGAWSLHMRTITLCDPSREGHPCPGEGSGFAVMKPGSPLGG